MEDNLRHQSHGETSSRGADLDCTAVHNDHLGVPTGRGAAGEVGIHNGGSARVYQELH